MNSIKKTKNGKKVLILGHFTPKSGQNVKRCITLIESALIDHALTAGYKILNVQGTRAAIDTVNFTGSLLARNVTGKQLSFKAKR